MKKYNIRSGVEQRQLKLKKIVVAVLATAGLATGLAVPAMAASSDSNASACGSVHAARADVNGNFGWLGANGGAAGYHGVTGQTPGATGYNNSHTDCQG